MVELRPYQRAAVDRVRGLVRDGKRRVIVVAPVGSGKTVLASDIIRGAMAKGSRCMFLAHRKELIDQPSKLLDSLGLDHGVIKGSHWRNRPHLPLQIASVQTLVRRDKPPADIVIIDETHRARAAQYTDILEHYKDAVVIGLTATPWRLDRRGLGEVFDELVLVAKPAELVAQGYLIDPLIKVPSIPDMAGSKAVGGDWTAKDAHAAMRRSVLVGDVVAHWRKYADGFPTVGFACTVEHSQEMTAAFNEAGIPAAHIDGTFSEGARDDVLGRLERGEIKVVFNVDLLCLDSETQILTSSGFVGIDEMTHDHDVANWNTDGSITFKKPKAVIVRERAPHERMVSVRGREMDIRVTDGHRMVTKPYLHAREYRVVRADALDGTKCVLPVSGVSNPLDVEMPIEPTPCKKSLSKRVSHNAFVLRQGGMGHVESVLEAKRRIEDRDSLRYTKPNELSLDDCKFIGFWIGDGSSTKLSSGGVEYVVAQSLAYPIIIEWFDNIIVRMGLSFVRKIVGAVPGVTPNDSVRWSFCRGTGFGSQRRVGLFRLEPFLDKDGTKLLWGLNEAQFDSFLEGFWMADGLHGDGSMMRKGIRITNTNKSLVEMVAAIAVCRGYRTAVRPQRTKGEYKKIYHLRCTKKQDHTLVNDRLRIEDGFKKERVWCVTTDSGFIVTRRHGSTVVVGNCEGWDLPKLQCCILARPTKSLTAYVQRVGRIMRTAPGKTDAIVLDHAGCTLRFGAVTEDREYTLDGDTPKRAGSSLKVCPECMEPVYTILQICPHCAYEWPEVEVNRDPARRDGELVDYEKILHECGACHEQRARMIATAGTFQIKVLCRGCRRTTYVVNKVRAAGASHAERMVEYDRLLVVARDKGFKEGWAAHKYKELFGVWPRRGRKTA